MPKPHRRQILEVTKPGQKLTLPYEDSAERVVHSYTVNYNFGEHCYGSFHAHPGETVKVDWDEKDGITIITRIPDPEED